MTSLNLACCVVVCIAACGEGGDKKVADPTSITADIAKNVFIATMRKLGRNDLAAERDIPSLVVEEDRMHDVYERGRRIWKVKHPSRDADAEIKVDAESGLIRSLSIGRVKLFPDTPPSKTRDEVLALAKGYAALLGRDLQDEHRLSDVQYHPETHSWWVRWTRHIGPYPFDFDPVEGVSVRINDESGALDGYGNGITDKQCPIAVKLNPDEAIQVARQFVQDVLNKMFPDEPFGITEVHAPRLCIVHPNYVFTPKRRELSIEQYRELCSIPCLVYAIECRVEQTKADERGLKISRPPITAWVDAATGEIRGTWY